MKNAFSGIFPASNFSLSLNACFSMGCEHFKPLFWTGEREVVIARNYLIFFNIERVRGLMRGVRPKKGFCGEDGDRSTAVRKEMNMDINTFFPSRWLRGDDLQGREATVLITAVTEEKVGDEQRPVLWFKGHEKGLVLNRTNADTLSARLGFDTENWPGTTVTLYTAAVRFQGQVHNAIRIRNVKPADTKANGYATQKQKDEPQIRSNPENRTSLGDELSDEIPF